MKRILIFPVFACALAGQAQEADCPVFGPSADRAAACVSSNYRNEGALLESLFARESMAAFRIVRVTSSLPTDIHSMLMASVGSGNVAEWGEDWSSGDIASRDDKRAQHVISFVSDDVSMVIFLTGGIGGPITNVLLTSKSSPAFCVFEGQDNLPALLTLTRLQAWAGYHKLSEAGSTCRAKDDELDSQNPV